MLKPGDLVRHRTGGPVMCVSEIDDDVGLATCEWLTDSGPREAAFSTSCLFKCSLLGEPLHAPWLGPEEGDDA